MMSAPCTSASNFSSPALVDSIAACRGKGGWREKNEQLPQSIAPASRRQRPRNIPRLRSTLRLCDKRLFLMPRLHALTSGEPPARPPAGGQDLATDNKG